jgi:AraC family transcriptional regulator
MSGVPSGVLRRLPIMAWTFVSGAGEIPGRTPRGVGNTDNLEPAALYLYRDWLPASGEEARDFPIYCQRLNIFPEAPAHETVAELFLPLK